MKLSFIQANWQRSYPFIYRGYRFMDSNNTIVPNDLIVGLRMTITSSDIEGSPSNLFINHIYTNNYNIGIGFANSSSVDICYANGAITQDNQSLTIYDYLGGVRGCVMIGNMQSTNPMQSFTFNQTTGGIEESTCLVLPSPAVTQIRIAGKGPGYTGNVTLTSSTLDIEASSTLQLSVINPATVASRCDKLAEYLTCTNTIISGINTVLPDKLGNINIFAIDPLRISQPNSPAGPIQLTTNGLSMNEVGVSADNLCKLINNPPINTSNTYGNLATTTTPEWKSWTQYEG